MDTWQHTTVLLSEAVESLLTSQDGHYVDATFGRGGHTRLLLSRLSAQGKVTAFDKDPEAIATAQGMQAQDARLAICHESFTGLANLPSGSAQGILMDLGISSPQIDDPARGFSFRNDGPLDMRMDSTRGQTVAQWLETASEKEIEEVIKGYGEERFARQIAKAIVAKVAAGQAPQRTLQLAELIAGVVRTREGGQHPATRSFQALRIFINRELDDLQIALQESLRVLTPGGRLVVIAFHSLEDRIVKQFIALHSKEVVARDDLNWMIAGKNTAQSAMKLEALGRIKPSDEEVAENPRSRSAIMRVAQRTNAP
ncbi:16S rRNA (cytosine(1402)-N(4))-methyltransferase RsmH [Variovorax sp. PCZ-1]|uniref:16S rRNA (cytosine(1402)-N(4))-methyltransferase RsmH n=1 Tax=Variovorax sp. PCZ-1 TaxID=2835533 RepID=UPI001BCEF5A6|nr:16S rRNA (cytosine(1402)-N(4))-methyltransferase RsmH [Variovorax sp. PCZ-1]